MDQDILLQYWDFVQQEEVVDMVYEEVFDEGPVADVKPVAGSPTPTEDVRLRGDCLLQSRDVHADPPSLLTCATLALFDARPVTEETRTAVMSLGLAEHCAKVVATKSTCSMCWDYNRHYGLAYRMSFMWESWSCGCCHSTVISAAKGHLECMKRQLRCGKPWHLETTSYAAKHGELECLIFARENGCRWNRHTTRFAAEFGKLACLKYAVTHGCMWHDETTLMAATGPQYKGSDTHDMARYSAYRISDTILLPIAEAMEDACLACLVYAHTHGCRWHPGTTASATKGKCLAYCLAHDPALVRDCGCAGRFQE